jgi:hypothetical protein
MKVVDKLARCIKGNNIKLSRVQTVELAMVDETNRYITNIKKK